MSIERYHTGEEASEALSLPSSIFQPLLEDMMERKESLKRKVLASDIHIYIGLRKIYGRPHEQLDAREKRGFQTTWAHFYDLGNLTGKGEAGRNAADWLLELPFSEERYAFAEGSVQERLERLLLKLASFFEEKGKEPSVELSFASKILNFLDDTFPIYDQKVQYVLHTLPKPKMLQDDLGAEDASESAFTKRIREKLAVFAQLEELYAHCLNSEEFRPFLEAMVSTLSQEGVALSLERTLDSVLFQLGKLYEREKGLHLLRKNEQAIVDLSHTIADTRSELIMLFAILQKPGDELTSSLVTRSLEMLEQYVERKLDYDSMDGGYSTYLTKELSDVTQVIQDQIDTGYDHETDAVREKMHAKLDSLLLLVEKRAKRIRVVRNYKETKPTLMQSVTTL